MFTTRVRTITTAGGAGAATGSARVGVPPCLLAGIGIAFEAGTPATVDIEILNELNGQERSLFLREDDNSDFPLSIPSEQPVDYLASALDVPAPALVSGEIVINVSDSDPDLSVVVTLLLKM